MMDVISRIRLLAGADGESDELLALLYHSSEDWIRAVCGIYDTAPSQELLPLEPPLTDAAVLLCVSRYQQLGSEGISQETVGPMSMKYEDAPHLVLQIIDRFRRIRF